MVPVVAAERSMKATVEELICGASTEALFTQVATLERYPPWMRLVHDVVPLEPDEGRLAWWVELRARVGPFARSKKLRMVRTVFEPDTRVRFERVQPDDREHAEWILDATVRNGAETTAAGDVRSGDTACAVLTMHLEYTGELWSAGVLGRILDDEVRRGARALSELFGSDRSSG